VFLRVRFLRVDAFNGILKNLNAARAHERMGALCEKDKATYHLAAERTAILSCSASLGVFQSGNFATGVNSATFVPIDFSI
jgi:hypothetical protein